jgi:hypothetical protein
MDSRIGPGPVFVFESLVAARRWTYYAGRTVFGLILLIALAIAWYNTKFNFAYGTMTPRQQLARMGQAFFGAIAGVELTLILFVAPAATAGAICLDRARGTLSHMMMTDLSDVEIVVGKLAARLAPVWLIVASTTPVLALAGLLGGIMYEAIAIVVLVTLALAAMGCSLAMAVSVRVLKAHEVLMAVYAVMFLWLLSLPVWESVGRWSFIGTPPDWYEKLNPYVLAFAPIERPGFLGVFDVVVFLVFCMAVSAASIAFALKTLRSEVSEQTASAPKRGRFGLDVGEFIRSRLPGPSLDLNPVLWREWHRSRPSKVARRVWMAYTVAVVSATAYAIYDVVYNGTRSESVLVVNAFSMMFGLLFVSATAPTVLSEERVRGSLDVLMTTPLATRTILVAKWWGVFRIVPRLAVLPALLLLMYVVAANPTTPPAGIGGRIVNPPTNFDRFMGAALPIAWIFVHGAMLASVGVALATWISRPGRAIAASVAFYILLTIGTIFVVELGVVPIATGLSSRSRGDSFVQSLEGGFIAISPFGAQITAPETVERMWYIDREVVWYVQTMLLIAAVGFSAGLLLLTIKTFNRCLGRMEEEPPVRMRRLKPKAPLPVLEPLVEGAPA